MHYDALVQPEVQGQTQAVQVGKLPSHRIGDGSTPVQLDVGSTTLAMTPRTQLPEPDCDDLVQACAHAVVSHQARRIVDLKIPKSVRAKVLDGLVARGFEVTKSVVRRSARDQIAGLIANGAYMPMSSIARQLVKVSAGEAKKAVLELVAGGQVVVVIRGAKPVLVGARARAFTKRELASLLRAVEAVAKQVRAATKAKGTLLRTDVAEALRPFVDAIDSANAARSVDRVVEVAKATLDTRLGLAFVPAVVEQLSPDGDIEAAKAAIVGAARQGRVELRPESGMGRLTPEQAQRCVAGPEGSVCSWIRVVQGGSP